MKDNTALTVFVNPDIHGKGVGSKLMDKVEGLAEKNGYKIVIKKFSDINFREENVEGQSIIYPSSEDNHRFYKSYIEDIILGLEVKGAHLIPKHNYLRAHDNKVFMEILRDMSGLEELKTIKTNHFGTYEEFIQKQTYLVLDLFRVVDLNETGHGHLCSFCYFLACISNPQDRDTLCLS